MQTKGGATEQRLGGQGPFEADSFHAITPIGIILNAEKIAWDRSPLPGAAAHDETCGKGHLTCGPRDDWKPADSHLWLGTK